MNTKTLLTGLAALMLASGCKGDESVKSNNEIGWINVRVISTLTTNWVTTSITAPVRGPDYRNHGLNALAVTLTETRTLHQTGTVYSNSVARFNWHNKEIECVLESVPIQTLSRDQTETSTY